MSASEQGLPLADLFALFDAPDNGNWKEVPTMILSGRFRGLAIAFAIRQRRPRPPYRPPHYQQARPAGYQPRRYYSHQQQQQRQVAGRR
jgi:hypothetical protein